VTFPSAVCAVWWFIPRVFLPRRWYPAIRRTQKEAADKALSYLQLLLNP
jgi:hypothetical protein